MVISRKLTVVCAVKYYSPTTNVCIIRVARDQHPIAWAGVTLMTNVEGRRYIPNVVHLSGMQYILPPYDTAANCTDQQVQSNKLKWLLSHITELWWRVIEQERSDQVSSAHILLQTTIQTNDRILLQRHITTLTMNS